jgi:hypothetical protein
VEPRKEEEEEEEEDTCFEYQPKHLFTLSISTQLMFWNLIRWTGITQIEGQVIKKSSLPWCEKC